MKAFRYFLLLFVILLYYNTVIFKNLYNIRKILKFFSSIIFPSIFNIHLIKTRIVR
jgi:hypothetical protein